MESPAIQSARLPGKSHLLREPENLSTPLTIVLQPSDTVQLDNIKLLTCA